MNVLRPIPIRGFWDYGIIRPLGAATRIFGAAALILAAFFVQISSPAANAQGTGESSQNPASRKAVLIVANAVSLADLAQAEMPAIRQLLRSNGAIALMNARTAGGYTVENSYVTIGAGSRALGSEKTGLASRSRDFYLHETAGAIYERDNGYAVDPDAIIFLDLPRLVALNRGVNHAVLLGGLGGALKEAGKTVAVLGNSDLGGQAMRPIVAMAMDELGQVPLGDVSKGLLLNDPLAPYGRRTDYPKLLERFREVYPQADLIVIETGDTLRVNEYSDSLTEQMLVRHRMAALHRVDNFIRDLLAEVDLERTRIILTSPQPSRDAARQGNNLSFVIMAGAGVQPGYLTTPTTHRTGIAANIDIAPTILDWLGVPVPYAMLGRPLYSQPAAEIRTGRGGAQDVLETLARMNRQIVATYDQRPPVIKSYVGVQIALILSAILVILLEGSQKRFKLGKLRQPLQIGMLALTAVPLTLLLLPLAGPLPAIASALLIIAVTVVLAGLTWLLHRNLADPFLLIYLVTAAALFIDTAAGAPLMQRSILGYDPIGGARYYGIGNEYMGVLVGAALVGLMLVLDRIPAFQKKWATEGVLVLLFIAIAFLIGSPRLGINVGGLLTALAAFVTAWLGLRNIRPRPVALLTFVVAVIAVLTGLAWWDYLKNPQGASHLGRLVNMVQGGGVGELVAIFARKLEMNWKLVHYTPWADVLLTFILVLGVLFYRPVGLLKTVMQKNPYLARGLWASFIGSVAAFAFNDSGVVAAATLMLYPTAILITLLLEERRFG
ncbi:MAG: hypothetical protein ACM3TT_04005 [Syntrophothermus sp.]